MKQTMIIIKLTLGKQIFVRVFKWSNYIVDSISNTGYCVLCDEYQYCDVKRNIIYFMNFLEIARH